MPTASVTKNVLVVVPKGYVAPEANPEVCVVIAPKQLSVPFGVIYVTTASHISKSLPCVISIGHVIAGFWVSFIVTVNEQLEVFPTASVTKNVLVVVPRGNVAPEANPPVCVVVIMPRQLSVPIGAI